MCAAAGLLYGVVVGSSTNAFLISFIILAISTIYFDSKIIYSTEIKTGKIIASDTSI